MPELPEAEVVRQQLETRVRGASIHSIWLGRDDIIRQGRENLPWFEGSQIVEVHRFGKSVVLECQRDQDQRYIVAELGMTGLILFQRESAPSEHHIHMVVHLNQESPEALHYWNARRFGRLSLLDSQGLEAYRSRRFGFDPKTMSEEEFVGMVKQCRGRVKALLLHQQRIAGIGNIYANEMLFQAGIHPYARGSRVSVKRVQGLYKAMKEIIDEAIARGGSSIRDFKAPDGTSGEYQTCHQIYQKEGRPCPRGCGMAIRSLRAERSSFYCPSCQKR
jgi:formamidopyrimidine-DNA glycosylase